MIFDRSRGAISPITAALRWILLLPVTFWIAGTAEALASLLYSIGGRSGLIAFGFTAAFAHPFIAVATAREMAPQLKKATAAVIWLGIVVEVIGRYEMAREVRFPNAPQWLGLPPYVLLTFAVMVASGTISAVLPGRTALRVRPSNWNPMLRNVIALPIAILAVAIVHFSLSGAATFFGLKDSDLLDLENRFFTASVFLASATAIVSSRKVWVCAALCLPFIGRGIWMIATGLGDDPEPPSSYARVEGAIEILATIVPLVATLRYRQQFSSGATTAARPDGASPYISSSVRSVS